MITYRLNDALPREVITSLREIPEKKQRLEFENALDAGYGRCWLERPEIARLIVDNFRHFDSQRYELIAYVVMPNHTHVLIRIFDGMTLSSIVHGWKSYTAKKIASALRAAGEPPALPIWQPEYWDRYIRNESHFNAAISYIHNNPVKAGLVNHESDWQWSSAPGSAGGPPADNQR